MLTETKLKTLRVLSFNTFVESVNTLGQCAASLI